MRDSTGPHPGRRRAADGLMSCGPQGKRSEVDESVENEAKLGLADCGLEVELSCQVSTLLDMAARLKAKTLN